MNARMEQPPLLDRALARVRTAAKAGEFLRLREEVTAAFAAEGQARSLRFVRAVMATIVQDKVAWETRRVRRGRSTVVEYRPAGLIASESPALPSALVTVRDAGAAARKRRQRAVAQAEGRRELTVTVSDDTLRALQEIARLGCGTVKGDAGMILRRAVAGALAEVRGLAAAATAAHAQAVPYLAFAPYLRTPGSTLRVGDRAFTFEEWARIEAAMGAVFGAFDRLRWPKARRAQFMALHHPTKQQATKTQVTKKHDASNNVAK